MGKRMITVAKIENDRSRMVSFSKRRKGLFKKVKELSALTGAHVAALVVSQAGRPSAEANPSIDSVVAQFFNFSGETESPDDGEASVVSSPDDSFDASLSALLNAKVDECQRIEELLALKENLEEMRRRVSLALDFRFSDSLLA